MFGIRGLIQLSVKRRKWGRFTILTILSVLLLTALSSVVHNMVLTKPELILLLDYKVHSLPPDNSIIGHDNKLVIHFDGGKGLFEKNSYSLNVAASQGWVSVRAQLPMVKLRGVRLDPSTIPAIIEIRNLKIVDEGGLVRLEIVPDMVRPVNQVRSLQKRNEVLQIETVSDAFDPQVYVSFEKEFNLTLLIKRLGNMKLFPVFGLLFWSVVTLFFFLSPDSKTKVVGLVVAMFLLFVVIYVKDNPGVLSPGFQWSKEKNRGFVNLALMAPLRVLADTSFLIQRSNISKSELPILRIFMSDGALRELV